MEAYKHKTFAGNFEFQNDFWEKKYEAFMR